MSMSMDMSCCYSVVQSCLTLCGPMNHSTPGFPVLHNLLEFAQTHVHWVGDAIQPSHPLSSPSPLAFNLSEHQGLFQRGSSSNEASGSQSFGVSASASVLPMNTQDWSPSGWTGWISLQSKGLSRVFSNATVQKHQFFGTQLSPLSHPYMTTGKTIALTIQTFVSKVMPLFFNMLCRFVIASVSRSKHLLISCLQTPSTVILESKKIKPVTVLTFYPSIFHEVMVPWRDQMPWP